MYKVRSITLKDAAPYLDLCRRLDQETSFMLYEPGERTTTVDEQRQQIESILKTDNQMIFVTETGYQLVGHLQAIGGRFQRNRRTVYLVVGILQEFSGQGIGTALFRAMEDWAMDSRMFPALWHGKTGRNSRCGYWRSEYDITAIRDDAATKRGGCQTVSRTLGATYYLWQSLIRPN